MDWQDIQDSQGEIFDIEQFREDIAKEKSAREEEERFVELCFDLMMEGEVDEDAIEEEAHRLLNEMDRE